MILDGRPGFLFGCDPEVFIKDPDGRFVSAEGLLPGTKEEPFKTKYGAVQVDGMAGEFNIDPAPDFLTFNYNIIKTLGEMKDMLPKGYTFAAIPAVEFDEDVWKAAPAKAKELGCTPDMNAWTGGLNSPPSDPENPRLRCAGGHVHIGWTNDAELDDVQHINNGFDLVKQLDWYLGAWSVRADADTRRRRLYGKAGACRIKDYGVEYRVLSNFWIVSENSRLAMWNRMQKAINDMAENFLPDHPEAAQDALLTSINTSKRSRNLEKAYDYPIVGVGRGL